MYFRLSTLLPIAAIVAVVSANGSSECNTGGIYCCNSVQSSDSNIVTTLAGLLGLGLSGITGQVGVSCSGILSSNSCTDQPVCCNGNSFNGLIVVGCSPISLGL